MATTSSAVVLVLLQRTSGCQPPAVTSSPVTVSPVTVSPVTTTPTPAPKRESRLDSSLEYRAYPTATAVIHTLRIPNQRRYQLEVAVVSTLATLEEFVRSQPASPSRRLVAALNGGFFDASNQQTTAFVIHASKIVADPRQNRRLTANPALVPYLEKIFNRSELRVEQCSSGIGYRIALRQTPASPGCQLQEAIGGGPQLLPLTAEAEGFVATVAGERVRDPLGIDQPNARTAVGLTAKGDLLWVMVAERPGTETTRGSTGGMTLTMLGQFLRQQGMVQALNLDGGSSSAMLYGLKTWYGKFDPKGNPVRRPLKSALLLYERNDP